MSRDEEMEAIRNFLNSLSSIDREHGLGCEVMLSTIQNLRVSVDAFIEAFRGGMMSWDV